MRLKEAVRTCLWEKYATFTGRAARSEYWWFVLFLLLLSFGVALALGVLGATLPYNSPELLLANQQWMTRIVGVVYGLLWLITLLPWLAVSIRRFHDVNLSGLWYIGIWSVTVLPYVALYVHYYFFGGFAAILASGSPFWIYAFGVFASVLPLVFFGTTVVVFIVAALRGTHGDNRHGPDPLDKRMLNQVFA